MYAEYKCARDAAWQTLIDCKITRMPVDLTVVIRHYGIDIVRYSSFGIKPSMAPRDGLYTVIDGRKVICINDQITSRTRRRHTLAHELGHCLLDTAAGPAAESTADIYARDLLAPTCVLAALGLHTADEIMRFCDISHRAAVVRAERMRVLYERNRFGAHPLERQVIQQFRAFVADHISGGDKK